ncbi:rhomboid family intramembrane serine protease [Streptomyces sp. NPDC032472]|uniref:rhomboid family intramembrane serine protease n=1 Tax=Streptomyces sp. NPDC032472 TaxID=3155018 RepID=UPI0034080339
MNVHVVVLYFCAAAVVLPGSQLIVALAGTGTGTQTRTGTGPGKGAEQAPPVRLAAALWGRPRPWASAVLCGLMATMAVIQTLAPAVMPHLERVPDGEWWRAVTALLVQTSGWGQLGFNLAALAVVAPAAERRLGGLLMLAVFLASGIVAQAVSMAGWSVHGGGDSVGICGLVGALAVECALGRGQRPRPLRLLSLLVPAAGVVLCLLENNHGMGLLAGSAAGVAVVLLAPESRERRRPLGETG